MKALIYTGIKENVVDIVEKPKPAPKEGQVLIKMSASALNHRDEWMRVGKYPNMEPNVTLGSDGCGIIEALGPGVDKNLEGRNVIINPNNGWGPDLRAQSVDYNILGMPLDGTFAEFIVVNQDRVHFKPEHLNDEEAAALPLGGLTAYRACFTHGVIKEGQNVLITGIGGGVALFALQFCLAQGARVYVSSSNEKKLKIAINMGAKAGFNYTDPDWPKSAINSTGGFDVIIDSAGGNAINNYIKVSKPGGIIVFYGSTTGLCEGVDLFRMFWSQVRLQGSTMGNDQEFAAMVKFVETYNIKPVVDSVRPFADIISSFDEMKQGTQMGKLVVKF